MSTAGPSSAELDGGVDLSASYGGLALGCVLCTVFWAFLVVQTVYYHIHFRHDAWPSRLVAWTMLAIGTAFQIMYLHGLWSTLIVHFGSPTTAVATHPSFAVLTVINACAGLVAQLFYTHRIWKFAQHPAVKWIVPACLIPLILLAFVTSAWWSHQTIHFQRMSQLPSIQWELYLFLVPAAVTDISIALTLSMLFRRSRTGIHTTDRILRTLVITSLNSGAWPAVFATLALILAALLPHALWYTALAYPTVQLYGNSVLGNLNARVALRRADNAAPVLGSYSFSTRGGARGTVSKPRSADRSHLPADDSKNEDLDEPVDSWTVAVRRLSLSEC